ncbi:SPFH domain-containing protein [Methyloglobulus sp.]|uniref:SPFH domain-containing protein n=1 Tax=Methyloglobulus sp. TaxID=2518622 RepID=UPI0032B76D24
MALFDGIRRQLRSVIEWRDPNPDALFYEWSDNGDEIKNASKLIVGPGQGCIFVYEGRVQSVLEEQCLVTLDTANIPFWTTIKNFMQFFESHHKVGIYFFRRTEILNQKWGTTSSIKYEDPKYKFPVGLKAYGNYSYRISDGRGFFVNVVGSHGDFLVEDFRKVMSERIIHPLSDFLAESKYSYADIDASRNEISAGVTEKLNADFGKLGFEMTDFRIEGTNFDDETLTRINRIANVTAEAQAAQAAGVDYGKLQQLEAMREAARNEGGAAGAGVGLGAGIGLGQAMTQAMQSPTVAPTAQPANDAASKLAQLKELNKEGLISDQEYADKRQAILDSL